MITTWCIEWKSKTITRFTSNQFKRKRKSLWAHSFKNSTGTQQCTQTAVNSIHDKKSILFSLSFMPIIICRLSALASYIIQFSIFGTAHFMLFAHIWSELISHSVISRSRHDYIFNFQFFLLYYLTSIYFNNNI